jgi:broad specificity phosphatase PhoE
MRPWGRPGRAAARPTVALVAFLLLAVVTGCGGGRPGPTEPAGSGAPSTLERPGGRDLVARLRQGGHVIFIRHAATEATQDDPRPDLADPSTQRNLSDAGRDQARQLGRAIGRLQIPVGTVLASPYARTRETAELAFGRDRVRVTRDLLNEAFPGTDDEDLARRLRRLFTTRPPAGQNTVLVSHGFNLQGATGLSVAEGESAIFSPATRAAPAWSPGSPPRSGRAWRSRADRGRRWDALRPSGMG